MSESKPCPFCGGKEMGIIKNAYLLYQVICHDCSSTGSMRETEEEAVEAWNRRVYE